MVKMVWFSFHKKPLEGENALYNLVAAPKGLPKHPVLLLENLRYIFFDTISDHVQLGEH